jgi:hypothetical protein
MRLYGLFLVVGSALAALGEAGPYKDHVLIKTPNSQFIQSFKNAEAVDIWEENRNFAVLRLSPSQYKAFVSSFPLGRADIEVLSNNVQELADRVVQKDNYKEGEDWFDNYHTYESIKDWYIGHSKKHPSHVRFVPSIGKSLLNNDIFAVHLSNNNTLPNGKTKSKIWLQSLIHAREWLSGSTAQYIFNELLGNHDTNPIIKKVLDENEIIFIPVVNPDGYIFTRVYRYWRKNRNQVTGVDINRNFPYRWGGPGASTNPLQDDYRGTGPASELETQAITQYFTKQGHIAGAIDFHTFSQLVLRPQGDTLDDAPHEKNLKELGDNIRDVIKQSRGTEYTSEKSIELYPTSGTAMDWFYGEGHTYGYTIELSPKDSIFLEGFSPPTSYIKPVGAELFPAAIHFINYVNANPIN